MDVWMLILLSFLLCTILAALFINWKKIDRILINNFALILGVSIGKLFHKNSDNNLGIL